jgi:hypothetical protein
MMDIALNNSCIENDMMSTFHNWLSIYITINDRTGDRYSSQNYSDTAAAIIPTSLEEKDEISSFQLMHESNALAFWDAPEEDIYSFNDGEAV